MRSRTSLGRTPGRADVLEAEPHPRGRALVGRVQEDLAHAEPPAEEDEVVELQPQKTYGDDRSGSRREAAKRDAAAVPSRRAGLRVAAPSMTPTRVTSLSQGVASKDARVAQVTMFVSISRTSLPQESLRYATSQDYGTEDYGTASL